MKSGLKWPKIVETTQKSQKSRVDYTCKNPLSGEWLLGGVDTILGSQLTFFINTELTLKFFEENTVM